MKYEVDFKVSVDADWEEDAKTKAYIKLFKALIEQRIYEYVTWVAPARDDN